jgi:chromosome segregation ATPase
MKSLNTKLEKINSAIEKRQSQLTRLDEDEDMKALTDKDKVKQIQKDIKTLEKAKAKIEKQLSKKDKVKKEVIDEDAPIEEAIDDKKLDDTSKSLEDIDKKVDDISKKTETMFESEGELPQNIINQAVKMFADVNGDTDKIIDIASKFPEYEDAVVEFLEGYDLGLDYDI